MNKNLTYIATFLFVIYPYCLNWMTAYAHKSHRANIITNHKQFHDNHSFTRSTESRSFLSIGKVRKPKNIILLFNVKKINDRLLFISRLHELSILRGGARIEDEETNNDSTSTIETATRLNDDSMNQAMVSPNTVADSNIKDESTVSLADNATESTTIETNTTNLSDATYSLSPRLNDLQQRAAIASLLLLGLFTIVYHFQETGVAILLFLISIGLYYEATEVIVPPSSTDGIKHTIDKIPVMTIITKWIWFIAYSLSGTILPILKMLLDENWYLFLQPICNLLSYCFVIGSFMEVIIRLNSTSKNSEGTPLVDFAKAWNDISYYHTSILFTVVPVSFWIKLLQIPFGLEWALYAAFLVIINDTAAYLFGSTIGKTSLIPKISPKKTLEGYIGALFFTILLSVPLWKIIMSIFNGNSKITIPLIHCWVIALYCGLIGPFGGFLASSVKRIFAKKDFGAIFLKSGHGGLIDRLDCHLFVIPFVYLYLQATTTNS